MPRRSQKKWTESEEAKLLRLHREAKSSKEIAKQLGRSDGAVYKRLRDKFKIKAVRSYEHDEVETDEEEEQHNKPYKPYTQVRHKEGIFCCSCDTIGTDRLQLCSHCGERVFHKSCITGKECPICKYVDNYKESQNINRYRTWNKGAPDADRLTVMLAMGMTNINLISEKFNIDRAYTKIINHMQEIKQNEENEASHKYSLRSKSKSKSKRKKRTLSPQPVSILQSKQLQSTPKSFCNNTNNSNNRNYSEDELSASDSDSDSDSDIEYIPIHKSKSKNKNKNRKRKLSDSANNEQNGMHMLNKKRKISGNNWMWKISEWNVNDVLAFFWDKVDGFEEIAHTCSVKFKSETVDGEAIKAMDLDDWLKFGIKDMKKRLQIIKCVKEKIASENE